MQEIPAFGKRKFASHVSCRPETEEQGRGVISIEESSPDPFERGTTEEGIVLAKHKGVEMEAAQAADDGLIAPFRSSLR